MYLLSKKLAKMMLAESGGDMSGDKGDNSSSYGTLHSIVVNLNLLKILLPVTLTTTVIKKILKQGQIRNCR